MVTGTSVLGVTINDGVMLAADTLGWYSNTTCTTNVHMHTYLTVYAPLGSYGSLARFRSVSRLKKVTDGCVVAASGDYADFQFLERALDSLV